LVNGEYAVYPIRLPLLRSFLLLFYYSYGAAKPRNRCVPPAPYPSASACGSGVGMELQTTQHSRGEEGAYKTNIV